jgi:hypothetical protein
MELFSYDKINSKKLNIKEKYALVIIVLIAFTLKLLWVVLIPNSTISDFQTYQNIATNVYKGLGCSILDGKPVAFQGMAYPIVLGYVYKIFGSNNIMYAKLFNLILSTITLINVFFITEKLLKKRRISFIAIVIVALLPNYIAYTSIVGTEVYSLFLFSIVVLLQLCSFDKRIRYPLIGIVTGLLALSKPYYMAYTVVLSIILIIANKNFKESLKFFLVTSLFMVLTIAPWTYRNYVDFKMFIPIAYNGGFVQYINNNDYNTNGQWLPLSDIKISAETKKKFLDAGYRYGEDIPGEGAKIELNPRLETIFKSEARKWIQTHPSKFLKLGFIRVNKTFLSGAGDIGDWAMNGYNLENNPKMSSLKFVFLNISNQILNILSYSGISYMIINVFIILFSIIKNEMIKISTPLLVFNIAFFLAIPFVYEGQQRYNYMILFQFAICAAIYIDFIMDKLSWRK